MNRNEPFMFYTERRLVLLTGVRATNLPQLLEGLRTVSGASIFYHTHQQYLSHHFEKPLFYNDFALWISQALQEEELAEQVASIDLLQFSTIRQLRVAIIERIEESLRTNGNRVRECPPGNDFHFCRSKSFVLPTGVVAHGVEDFFEKLTSVTIGSLYFHFFEARLRLERLTNDFSYWLEGRGEEGLARAIERLDPYVMSLEELRSEIIKLGTRARTN
ncbi:MAG: DUF5752 family protein [Acidobacteriota bacterium]